MCQFHMLMPLNGFLCMWALSLCQLHMLMPLNPLPVQVGSLARHEWKKHGTCTGLQPDGYFAEALRAMQVLQTPAVLTNNAGGTVPASSLRSAYTRRVAIRADKHCRLAEVTSCWEKLPDGRLGGQVDCPDHVMRGRDSTKCSSFLVTALGQCMAADSAAKKKR